MTGPAEQPQPAASEAVASLPQWAGYAAGAYPAVPARTASAATPSPGQGGAVIGRESTMSLPTLPSTSAAGAVPAQRSMPAATNPWAAGDTQAAAQTSIASTATPIVSPAGPLAAAAGGYQNPPDDTPDGPEPPRDGGPRSIGGRLARLRIGSHTASRSALARIRISAPATGLVVGADHQRNPVAIRFFRTEPTRVALVGGAWAGQLLTFRAFALGARVAVVTVEPQTWQGLGQQATGHSDRLVVLAAGQRLPATATAQQPVLLIHDVGTAQVPAPQPLGPWQTRLTIVRQLDQSAVPAIQNCDLVLLQRLDEAEARLACGALRLPPASAQLLRQLTDDMVALVSGGADRYVWLAQTQVEQQYGGAPRR